MKMVQSGTPLTPSKKRLRKRQLKAAHMLAEDRLTDEQIAEKVGIGRTTLARWKMQSYFAAKVESITAAYADRAMNHGLAKKEKRLAELDDVYYRIRQVIEERSTDTELASVPGGKTGLVTKTLKGIGKGDDFRVVEVYEVDTALTREMRAIQQQYAEELGQRAATQVEVSITMTPEQRIQELRKIVAAAALRGRVAEGQPLLPA